MNKGVFFSFIGTIFILLLSSLHSRGGISLPRPVYIIDSIPVATPQEQVKTTTQEQPVKDLKDVIKEVPKAKKQIKPIAVPGTVVPVKTPQIIKPKIVIKRIGVHIP